MNRITHRLEVLLTAVMVAVGLCAASALVLASQRTAKGENFAQKLVQETLAKHPEADEISIAVRSARRCKTIASTDRGDIGEQCGKEDSEPMRTGKPYVEKEKDGYDVSVALHDATGKLVGSAGVGLKPAAGQTEASPIERAGKIAREMEAQIPSRARLFARER
jgi:hypothetical protein